MNYVEHHFGDYARDTAHLSLLEHGAYRLLLDLYYVREKALPADVKDCCRLVRAASTVERKAVQTILSEFFELTADGWAHKRCDAEIARYRERQQEQGAKHENERERQRRHREERRMLFEKLRELDIVPAWDTKTETLRAMVQQRTSNADGDAPVTPPVTVTDTEQSQPVTPPVTRTATANQTPPPTTQAPDTKGKEKPKAAAAAAAFTPPDWVPADDWQAFAEHRRQAKKPMTHRASELVVLELDKLRNAGHQPGLVLQQSVRRGWLDVFPVKSDTLPPTSAALGSWRAAKSTV